jgi:gag-polypeptide of LTR copia-type
VRARLLLVSLRVAKKGYEDGNAALAW